jgi:DNA-binding transcriptional ArsR family regulator
MALKKVKQLDAASLRALAHPLRVRIVGRLRVGGPATATMLADDLGESSGATSYHLRALAKAGFVEEEVGRGTGRERWWRAAHDMTSWHTGDLGDDPDAEAAEEWLLGFHARQAMDRIDAWLDQRTKADPQWVAVADQSDYFMRMTPEQVRAMLEEVHAVIQRHITAADDAPTPPDALLARLFLFAVPDHEAMEAGPSREQSG